jgi:hypothetical protein
MALLETWRNLAYGDGLDDKKREELWSGYFQIEKGIYEQILSQPEQVITGTVKELAEKYNTEILIMTGFLDGINESLKGYENPIDTMEEDTEVKIEIDPEKLYYNMVEAKATWLYELPQWDAILTPEKRKELYKSQKASGTVRKAKKIFPLWKFIQPGSLSFYHVVVQLLRIDLDHNFGIFFHSIDRVLISL